MKQTIEYYYNLKIDKLYMQNNNFNFTYENNTYYFCEYLRDLKELDDLLLCYKELKQKNINVHDLIYNMENSLITKVDDKNNKKRELYRNNWEMLWSSKIDYIENQLNEIKVDNIIHKSIDYYLGLSETAISYVNSINRKYEFSNNDKITLAHKRIYYPNYALNYLNPLSFIFDVEIRDIAEYIKSVFFQEDNALLELIKNLIILLFPLLFSPTNILILFILGKYFNKSLFSFRGYRLS